MPTNNNTSTRPAYQVIALDLDGTLTNHNKEITQLTHSTLMKVQKDGGRIILASGRPTYGIAPIAECLQIEKYGGYILSYNGGKIIDWHNKKEIYSNSLPDSVLPILYKYSKEKGHALLGYDGKEIITETPDDKYVKEESRINKMNIRKVDNLLHKLAPHPTKLLMTGEPAEMETAEKELRSLVGKEMDVFRSAPFFIELVPKGIDKAQSLMRLLSAIGLTPADMIAFGDGYNDISMLKLAGAGVAMSNAVKEVKNESDYVTLSNEDDGVAVAIEKLCYGNHIQKVDTAKYKEIDRPMYILEERRLRHNLEVISGVAKRADVEIILAFKAYALWKTFPIFREYINATTASSLAEARLAVDKFGNKAHTFSPAYTDYEIDEIARCSSHLTFNSLSQYERLHNRARKANSDISFGVRVNPEYSEIETDIYNPCAPGTRFGICADKLPETLPTDIDGFHCHCHCENGSDVFVRTLRHIEDKFAKWFRQIKWINFGGGHLMTRKDYDIDLLVDTLQSFHSRYPWLKVIMEPGSAFGWQTGPLVAQVIDIVEDKGIKTAILNVSFSCHMPDCLEMPYHPTVRGAETIEDDIDYSQPYTYRLGANSCLSGDFMSAWRFNQELQIGENVIFEDMNHYTTVKTTMFNGISHPALAMVRNDGETLEILRDFSSKDYISRMD